MWNDILLSLVTSVGEAICSKFLAKTKLKKFNEKLRKTVVSLFSEFADSSLDCNEFAKVIGSITFNDMLRNYFCTIKDGQCNEAYFNKFEIYIISACPNVETIEVRRFIRKTEELYTNYLVRIIEDNYELNAFYQLITVAYRELIGKILQSEKNMCGYIASLSNREINIDEEEIIAYHNVCNEEFGKIKFTGIAGVENKNPLSINEYYVKNNFIYYSKDIDLYKTSNNEMETLELKDFFMFNNKIILIGGAGLGKSTTLNYLYCNYKTIFGLDALKIKIDLKEYAKDIYEEKRDILWCLSKEFSRRVSKAKYVFSDIESIIAKYLDEGKCLIILDALDEIPTQAIRNKVRDEISNFTQVYFLNRFIISTREVGYLKNKFEDSFLHIKICEFDDGQIEMYAYNWYSLNYDNLLFDDFWGKFRDEVVRSRCKDIIRNPIVLILALVIFDIEKSLPNRRVEFYRKCIDTFLEVRENRKAAFEMDIYLRNILGNNLIVPRIAYYKFEKITQDIGYRFTYEELINALIQANEIRDIKNWIDAIKRFARYLVDRTELIKEIDDNNLEFAHKTFYEYFLAVYFSKEYDAENLHNVLLEWIGDSNYDELARLIIEVIVEKNDYIQHKKLILFLFDQMKNAEKEKTLSIFSIIAELYKNGMLQAKFHEIYDNFILYNSRYIGIRNRRTEKRSDDIIYNSNILAEKFCEILSNNVNELPSLIESLYYLNNSYKNEVIKRSKNINIDINFRYIAMLFSWVYNTVYRNKSKNQKLDFNELHNYFTGSGKNILMSCPSIFVSYVTLYCLENKNNLEIDEVLFEFYFEPASVFNRYTTPSILYCLVTDCFKSWDNYLLLIICIIHCAKGRTNWVLGFILDHADVGGSNKNDETKNQICTENCRKLWELLNTTEYEHYITQLMELDIFNDKYLQMYERLFLDYSLREKDVFDSRTAKLLKKRR